MRNSQAQRYARWSLAAAGLLAILVAAVYARNIWLAREAAKKAPPAVPASVEQRSDEFAYSKVEGQRTVYTVRASRTTQFKEGNRNLLEDVDISVYGKKGERNDTLRTKACDFISNTGTITCAGEVQINLQSAAVPANAANSIHVSTSALTFDRDSGEARTDNPVTFHWPAGDGRAVGLIYDSDAGTLRLARQVELSLSPSSSASKDSAPAADEKKVRIAGDSMSFHRDSRVVLVDGHVHAQQYAHELYSENLRLELDAAFDPRRLVASGHPELRDLNPQGPTTLSADEIVSLLREDGSVESIVGTGNVHSSRNTPVGGEDIAAGRIEIDLASGDNLPKVLTASKGVTLTSTSASFQGGTRHVQSDALEVRFAGGANGTPTDIESINSLAPARADWRSVALVNGKPVPQLTRIAGQQINLKFDAQNQLQQLAGSGGVEVARKLGDAPEETTTSRELIAKFDKSGEWSAIDQTGDVHFHDALRSGQGDRAHVDRPSNTVTLDGSVLFADATTRTSAQSAAFVSSANSVRADGHVVTTELRAGPGGMSNLAPEPAHISAEHLVADTLHGHAVYTGKCRFWQGQSLVEGDAIELDNAARTVKVRGNVRGTFPQAAWNPKPGEGPGQRQSSSKTAKMNPGKSTSPGMRAAPALGRVRGGTLTYWDNESRGEIEQDARVDSEQASIQADHIDLYFTDAGAASGTKQLSRSVASGDVVVRQDDRRGKSDRAEYTASEGKFVLSGGNPTLYSSTGDTTTGRQLTFFFADDRILVDSADGSKTVTLHPVEK